MREKKCLLYNRYLIYSNDIYWKWTTGKKYQNKIIMIKFL